MLGANGNCILNVHEVSGLTGATPFDKVASSGGTSTAPTTTGTTTDASNVYAAALICWQDSTTTIGTLTGGFTSDATQTSTGTGSQGFQHGYILNSNGIFTYGGTLSVSKRWSAAVATFKGTAVAQVQASVNASSNALTTALTVTITSSGSGNALIACIGTANAVGVAAAKVLNVSDDLGQVWTRLSVTNANPGTNAEIWYRPQTAAAVTAVTATLFTIGPRQTDQAINRTALW